MEVEKRGSKDGSPQLFDWNSKSRKKRFSNKSDFQGNLSLDVSRQEKEHGDNLSMTGAMEVDANGQCSSIQGGNYYSCNASVVSDEGNCSRAPGIVARLMGLDFLPTSSTSESSSVLPFNCKHHNCKSENVDVDLKNISNRFEEDSRPLVEPRLQKGHSRPIERFQTEVLPPKSAKTIPITHHKLLSPIKSPAFTPIKNPAYIMEVAAKIIEPGHQVKVVERMPHSSCSVPSRIWDLREKMEAARRGSSFPEASKRLRETNAVKTTKGQSSSRRWNGPEVTPVSKGPVDSENTSSISLKNKGKAVSHAARAKVNARKRDGLSSSANGTINQPNKVISDQPLRSQASAQKRISTDRTSNVLRQNNRKQNSPSNKDRIASSTVSNHSVRKAQSEKSSFWPNKIVNKVVVSSEIGSRKKEIVAPRTDKEPSKSNISNSFRKRELSKGNILVGSGTNIVSVNREKRPIQCSIAKNGCMNLGSEFGRNGMDVVSFTFTSPIRSMSGAQSSDEFMEQIDSLSVDACNKNYLPNSGKSNLSSVGLNIIAGDNLSDLLEQKLIQLAHKLESSHSKQFEEEIATSSESSLEDAVSTVSALFANSLEDEKRFHIDLDNNDINIVRDLSCSTADGLLNEANQKLQGSAGTKAHGYSSNSSLGVRNTGSHYPVPVSVVQGSPCDESCRSSDFRSHYNYEGSMQSSSDQSQEVMSWILLKNYQSTESETEFLDTTSSCSTWDISGKNIFATTELRSSKRSINWELDYLKDILYYAGLKIEEFALGKAQNVLNLNLFNQLENYKFKLERNVDRCSRLGRKVLFDCVNECLDLRCREVVNGSYNVWVRWRTLFWRQGWLADELYKDISGWRSMGDLNVDELVDKDMSTSHGRWLDFVSEAFGEGMEIEKAILNTLVEEVVADFLF